MNSVQIELREKLFDSFQELLEYRKTVSKNNDHGACSTFIGTMRDYNEGERVFAMQLEHYPGMTEKQLEEIVGEAHKTHEILDGLLFESLYKLSHANRIDKRYIRYL